MCDISISERRGRLVIVGTPIGNLGDLSPRAVAALAEADVVACEDTRRTRALLAHAGVAGGRRLVAVNEHNEQASVARVLEHLEAGDQVAVVSDAGMPAISDPGERLVRAASGAGYEVVVVPGPSAAVAALVLSGLPAGRFCFEGFLARKPRARAARLAELAGEERTLVFFEAPHRLAESVADLGAAFGAERRVAVCRELTKRFEEVWRGTLAEAVAHVAAREPRGEYVLVVDGAPPRIAQEVSDDVVVSALEACMGAGLDRRAAVAEVAAALDLPKRRVYEAATGLDPAGQR